MAPAIKVATEELGPPCTIAPSSTTLSKRKGKSVAIPSVSLISTSTTPSPWRLPSKHTRTRNSKTAVLPTPTSRSDTFPLRDRRGQPTNVPTRPPMLDLKKMLKRSSSSAELPRHVTKRRKTRSSIATPSSSSPKLNPSGSYSAGLHSCPPHELRSSLCTSPRALSQEIETTPPRQSAPATLALARAPVHTLTSSPRSIANNIRRAKAKETQMQGKAREKGGGVGRASGT
ncbi:hypothetical protein K439DRAFT_1629591, partial [Ramaria rubella]